MLTLTPLGAFFALFFVPIRLPTMIFAVVLYFLTGLGITAGYHRLLSHRAYTAHPFIKILLTMFGGMAVQGSAIWWCRNHRAHHRFVDTIKDPYNVHRGFFWAHIGWMIHTLPEETRQGVKVIDAQLMSDLYSDPILRFQHKYFKVLSIFISIILPTLISGLWGDMLGGYFYACLGRIFFVHHATFFVNSLAHYYGNRTYSDLISAEDSVVTALLTLGEGHHNYHHEFSSDFRNGVQWYHYDPTKWLILLLSYLGVAWDLQKVSDEEIEKARVQTRLRYLLAKRQRKYDSLQNDTVFSMHEFETMVKKQSRQLILHEGSVYDVAEMVDDHPGGRLTLLNFIGKDVTQMFTGRAADQYGHQHIHTQFAKKILKGLRIGKIASNK